MLLVTTATTSDTRFTPPLVYDRFAYPLQTIIERGITFYRGTRIDLAYQTDTQITTTTYIGADTGMKLITVYVIRRDGTEWKYQEVQNLMANPAVNPLNATFSGTVNKAGGGTVAGALVE